MSAQDYRINAEARRLLVSRWVDVSRLQLGTTNGVLYIMGTLDTTMEDPTRKLDSAENRDPNERVQRLVSRVEKELRRLRDVRDVVFRFDNVYKHSGRWRSGDARKDGSLLRMRRALS